ncbi:MAG TPA: diguanylate cyclase [Candidatus Hydrogenedentes bacterium]|nr:diguanylate cyclase [Candidatus Hydrogenedentota bacterium]HOH49325.1 diguanylate cyclase [Candidatus Hydrogenedentota bacterium]
MRVLVAEDDPTSRVLLATMLKKWGHEPVCAADGLEAWSILEQAGAPRLVLLDWVMPGLDGPEVCRRLRAVETSDPPFVIMLTGRAEKGDIILGLDAGANDYLAKPYDPEELRARLGVACRMLELQRGLLEARDRLEHLAMHDPLTGVLNRRAVLERLEQEISRAARSDGRLFVGMCDLDHFKRINDTLGHQAGDDVLAVFTRRIAGNLRAYDSIGRYGGEEFLVITPATGKPDPRCLFERLRAEVEGSPIETRAGEARISVSIGVAAGSGKGSVADLIEAADRALYLAKSLGRNRVVLAPED